MNKLTNDCKKNVYQIFVALAELDDFVLDCFQGSEAFQHLSFVLTPS